MSVYYRLTMRISASNLKTKRFRATFKDGTKVNFGSKGGNTLIDNATEKQKSAYLARHSKNNEDWNDYKSAGALSRHLLWKSKSLTTNIKEYKKRFNL